jgi:predicted tellurium resistance membrane protein TerC
MIHDFFDVFFTWQGWLYLLILSLLEIVLGIDNIIFISIVTDHLEPKEKRKARNLGLSIALLFRLILLGAVSYLMHLVEPIFSIGNIDFSGQSVILIIGGLFLIYKSVAEMHKSISGEEESQTNKKSKLGSIISQIVIIDLVFSFDSIISAIGMTNGLEKDVNHNPMAIIVFAIIISMIIMLLFAKQIGDFIHEHPTIKMIALSFLVAIGMLLIAEGFGQEFPKGYIYFALVYALIVEMLNIKMRKKQAK